MAKHRQEVLAKRREKGKEVRAKSKEYMREYLRVYYLNPQNVTTRKERALAYYRDNRERVLENVRRYKDENYDTVLANMRAWKKAHPEAFKRWAANNPDKVNANRQRRRARLLNAPINDFTAAQWISIQEVFDHRCAYCNKRRKGRLTQDHITPLSKGGSHTAANIVPACKSCNSAKRDRPPLRPVQPFLILPPTSSPA